MLYLLIRWAYSLMPLQASIGARSFIACVNNIAPALGEVGPAVNGGILATMVCNWR